MRRLGKCGFNVPAVTLNPSDSIAFANSLASTSVENDFVCLADGARNEVGRHSLGHTTETYQRLLVKRIDPANGEMKTLKVSYLAQSRPRLHFCFLGGARSFASSSASSFKSTLRVASSCVAARRFLSSARFSRRMYFSISSSNLRGVHRLKPTAFEAFNDAVTEHGKTRYEVHSAHAHFAFGQTSSVISRCREGSRSSMGVTSTL
jgi:hypothetical protein